MVGWICLYQENLWFLFWFSALNFFSQNDVLDNTDDYRDGEYNKVADIAYYDNVCWHLCKTLFLDESIGKEVQNYIWQAEQGKLHEEESPEGHQW